MTVKEFRDLFVAEYTYECQKRKVSRIEMPDGLIAAWLAEAQQQINIRLKPIKKYQDVEIIAGATDFTLNTDFGKPIKAYLGDSEGTIGDTEVDLVDTLDLSDNEASGNQAAIFWDPTNSIYYIRVAPTPISTFYIRVWYYADTLWYSPSGSVSQDWGIFDGSTFSGNFMIPDKFQMLIKHYLLGKAFNDFSEYEKNLSILRVNNANTMKLKPEYKYNDP